MGIVFILAQDVATLIDFFTFTMWIFYSLAFFLVVLLRITKPDAHRPYRVLIEYNIIKAIIFINILIHSKVPIIIPCIITLVGCYLVVAPIISDPAIEYAYVLAVFVVGVLFYIPFVYYKYSFGFMGNFNNFFKKVFLF